MKRTAFALLASMFFAFSATAQSQSGAQADTQASGQASVQAGKQGAQANATGSAASSVAAQSGQNSAALASGTAFNAALNAPLDSKKAKSGDSVTAHTTEAVKSEGKTVLPKGTKVIGHVTQASARGKGDAESSLGVVFDKAVLKNGQEVPLNVAIQAAAAAQSNVSAAGSDINTMGSLGGSAAGSGMAGGRGALGGVTSAVGGATGAVTNTAANVGSVAGGAVNTAAGATANAAGSVNGVAGGTVGGLNSAGQLTSNSRGVFGLNGVNLNAAASNTTQGSVFTSAGKNVHLDSGTRMLLVSQVAAGTQDRSKQAAPAKAGASPEPKPGPKAQSAKPNQE